MNINVPISEVMTTDVVSVEPQQKLIDVKHIFEKKNFHHHIPVTENGRLVGMISLVDYLYAIKNASIDDSEIVYSHLFVKDIMRENPISTETNATLKQIAETLAKGEVHALVVVDKGYLKGIISTADVIRYFITEK